LQRARRLPRRIDLRRQAIDAAEQALRVQPLVDLGRI
jgi:hypothetical protein